MTVIGIIQARLGSSRLPGKILAPIAGRPMLQLISQRLAGSGVDEWWLATSSDRADDVTESWGHCLGLRVFRGENENVLSRFTEIIGAREPDWIVRVTADNPFVSAEAVDRLLAAREEVGADRPLIEFAGDAQGGRTLPLGFGMQLARADAVMASADQIPADQPHHRAHVLSWLDRGGVLNQGGEPNQAGGQAKCCPVPAAWPARPHWRWTVDTFDDLAMARSAFALFADRAVEIGYPEMVACLDARPDITTLNRNVQQKLLVEG